MLFSFPQRRVLFPISAAVKVMHSVLGTDRVGEWIGTCKTRNGVPLKELADWIAGEYYVYELHLPDVQKLASREERDINSHSALTGRVAPSRRMPPWTWCGTRIQATNCSIARATLTTCFPCGTPRLRYTVET
jgi:hypothetical protein